MGRMKAIEGSNKVDILTLGVVIKVVEADMTSRCDSECLAPFKALIGVILVKLDVSDITSSQAQ